MILDVRKGERRLLTREKAEEEQEEINTYVCSCAVSLSPVDKARIETNLFGST